MERKIDIETRLNRNGKEVDCYIPKINGINILGENCFILKESVSLTGVITNNLEFTKSILEDKVKEVEKFLLKNGKLL